MSTIAEAISYAKNDAAGSPITIHVPAGTHTLDPISLSNMSASELWLKAEHGAVLQAGSASSQPTLTVTAGAPRIHLDGFTLVDVTLLVDGGPLELHNVTMTSSEAELGLGKAGRRLETCDCDVCLSQQRRRTASSSPSLPALEVTGATSDVVVSGTTIEGFSAGGIVLASGQLAVADSVLRGNFAPTSGGALRVSGGRARVSATTFESNGAAESGGALQVDGSGVVELGNRTAIVGNDAPTGASIQFVDGSLSYSLPTPLGRWLLVSSGTLSTLEPTSIDADYPFACSAGIVGSSYATDEQNGPWCSGVSAAGYYCASACHEPTPCTTGSYCKESSSSPTECPAGTHTNLTRRTAEKDCLECDAGTACVAGSALPTPCAAGRVSAVGGAGECTQCAAGKYQGQEGQTACSDCPAGYFCSTGAAEPSPCPGGTFSGYTGLESVAGCQDCTVGFFCSEGSAEPSPCAAGTIGLQSSLMSADQCYACVDPAFSTEGTTACSVCKAGYFAPPSVSSTSGADTTTTSTSGGAEVACDQCIDGVTCPQNSTLASVVLGAGLWRQSAASRVVSSCVQVNLTDPETGERWEGPCKGGDDAGVDGVGYCHEGYAGPLCEICNSTTAEAALAPAEDVLRQYFARAEGRCLDCPSVGMRFGAIAAGFVALVGLLLLLVKLYQWRRQRYGKRVAPELCVARAAFMYRLRARISALALMPKIKLIIAFYQSVQVLPTVYSVELPPEYYRWMSVFDWVQLDWLNTIVPGACLEGGYLSRLLLKGLTPLAGMLLILLGGWAYDVLWHVRAGKPLLHPFRGLLKTLPLVLFISFSLCASVSASIFAAWSCEEYVDDSAAGTVRAYLREDPSIRCSIGSFKDDTHTKITTAAILLVLIWPVAMPLVYLGLLLPCRKKIMQQKSTAAVRAIAFLHREYEPWAFWWEPIFLLQRMCIVGYFQVIPEEYAFIRVLSGLLLSIVYAMSICSLKPYKRFDVDVLAITSQFALVCVFVGATVLRLFDDLEAAVDTETAVELTGFSSTVQVVAVMLIFNLSTFAVALAGIAIQGATQAELPVIRGIADNQLPELSIGNEMRYHLFLSHIWSSGQDQVAIIKRQLQLLLPGIVVFLDVDDLEEIGNLEQYITASQCVLVFLSKGYFFSTNCKRELRQSLTEEKPLCLVHERDTSKGGAPIDTLRNDCPEECRSALFHEADRWLTDRPIIGWYRVSDFQVVSLKAIAAATLGACNQAHLSEIGRADLTDLTALPAPSAVGAPAQALPEELYYVPGELSRMKLELKHAVKLYASKANPGAKEAAEEIVAQLGTPHLSLGTPHLSLSTQLEGATHLVLFLNDQTFLGSQGAEYASDVRRALENGISILLLHENDPAKGGCEFSTFFRTTPEDLISAGIYSQIAVALHLPPHRTVSIALAAKALGARQIDRSFSVRSLSVRSLSVKSLSVKSLSPRWLLQTQQQDPTTQVAAMSAKTARTAAPQHRPSSSLGNPAANPAASVSSTDDTK